MNVALDHRHIDPLNFNLAAHGELSKVIEVNLAIVLIAHRNEQLIPTVSAVEALQAVIIVPKTVIGVAVLIAHVVAEKAVVAVAVRAAVAVIVLADISVALNIAHSVAPKVKRAGAVRRQRIARSIIVVAFGSIAVLITSGVVDGSNVAAVAADTAISIIKALLNVAVKIAVVVEQDAGSVESVEAFAALRGIENGIDSKTGEDEIGAIAGWWRVGAIEGNHWVFRVELKGLNFGVKLRGSEVVVVLIGGDLQEHDFSAHNISADLYDSFSVICVELENLGSSVGVLDVHDSKLLDIVVLVGRIHASDFALVVKIDSNRSKTDVTAGLEGNQIVEVTVAIGRCTNGSHRVESALRAALGLTAVAEIKSAGQVVAVIIAHIISNLKLVASAARVLTIAVIPVAFLVVAKLLPIAEPVAKKIQRTLAAGELAVTVIIPARLDVAVGVALSIQQKRQLARALRRDFAVTQIPGTLFVVAVSVAVLISKKAIIAAALVGGVGADVEEEGIDVVALAATEPNHMETGRDVDCEVSSTAGVRSDGVDIAQVGGKSELVKHPSRAATHTHNVLTFSEANALGLKSVSLVSKVGDIERVSEGRVLSLDASDVVSEGEGDCIDSQLTAGFDGVHVIKDLRHKPV